MIEDPELVFPDIPDEGNPNADLENFLMNSYVAYVLTVMYFIMPNPN